MRRVSIKGWKWSALQGEVFEAVRVWGLGCIGLVSLRV